MNPEIRPPNAWAKYPEPIDSSNVCSVLIEWMTGLDCLWRTSVARLRGLGAMENTRESAENRLAAFSGHAHAGSRSAWLFIFPDCIGLLVFVAIPMVLALSLGFFNVDGFGGYKFAGLANYNRMLRDPLFMKSLGVTTVYVLCLVPGLYVSGLGLALLVRQRIPLVGLWRTLFFMPFVVSLAATAGRSYRHWRCSFSWLTGTRFSGR